MKIASLNYDQMLGYYEFLRNIGNLNPKVRPFLHSMKARIAQEQELTQQMIDALDDAMTKNKAKESDGYREIINESIEITSAGKIIIDKMVNGGNGFDYVEANNKVGILMPDGQVNIVDSLNDKEKIEQMFDAKITNIVSRSKLKTNILRLDDSNYHNKIKEILSQL